MILINFQNAINILLIYLRVSNFPFLLIWLSVSIRRRERNNTDYSRKFLSFFISTVQLFVNYKILNLISRLVNSLTFGIQLLRTLSSKVIWNHTALQKLPPLPLQPINPPTFPSVESSSLSCCSRDQSTSVLQQLPNNTLVSLLKYALPRSVKIYTVITFIPYCSLFYTVRFLTTMNRWKYVMSTDNCKYCLKSVKPFPSRQ